MTKKYLLGGVVMILVGIMLGVGGFFFYKTNKEKIAESEQITATINEIETIRKRSSKGKTKIEHKVYIDFEYDDKEYEHYKLGYYDSSMHEGKDIEVYVYEPSNGDIEVLTEGAGTIFLIVFSVFAAVFVGVGIGMVAINAGGNKRESY